jgi:hypothetical protein
MNLKNVIALMMAAALFGGASAQNKKSAVPATATPVKTVKVLTSRLAAAARLPLAKEDPKAKKNAATKATAKPLALAKLNTTSRPPAASAKALPASAKTKSVKAATEPKLASPDPRAKGLQLRSTKSAPANENLRKGKFGKPLAEPKRAVTPIIAKREDFKREVEPATRRPRPRAADDEPKDNLKDEPKENAKDNAVAEERIADAPKLPIARPDRVEVIEPHSPQLEQLQALRNTRPLPSYGAIVTRTGTPPAVRKDLNIPQQRVFEIQYELAKRGFFAAEPNGLYDDTTVAAMWEFQKNYGLPATGYPTAHALKRLGLTSW